jgi:hypothetical protein
MHTKTTFALASTRTRTQTCEEGGHQCLLKIIKENEGKTAKMTLIFIKHHAMET